MNIKSISALEPVENNETVQSMAKRALYKWNEVPKTPQGPTVEKLARKAKKQIFGGVAGGVAREMLEEDEKEAEKVADAEIREEEKLENEKVMKDKLEAETEDAAITLVKQTKKAEETIKE